MSDNTERMAPMPTLQTYALSTYPGEHAMVVAHPSNCDAQWYRREDVEKLIATERAEREVAEAKYNEEKQIVSRCWIALSIASYDEVKPYSVDEHISRLKQRAEAAEAQLQTLHVELDSRSIWIQTMNEILGYDNSDGFHSEPSPHELARQLVAQLQIAREVLEKVTKYIGPFQGFCPIRPRPNHGEGEEVSIQFYRMPDRGQPMVPCQHDSYDAQWVRREDFESERKRADKAEAQLATALQLTTTASIRHVQELQKDGGSAG